MCCWPRQHFKLDILWQNHIMPVEPPESVDSLMGGEGMYCFAWSRHCCRWDFWRLLAYFLFFTGGVSTNWEHTFGVDVPSNHQNQSLTTKKKNMRAGQKSHLSRFDWTIAINTPTASSAVKQCCCCWFYQEVNTRGRHSMRCSLLDGMAGDWQHEHGGHVKGWGEERGEVRRGVRDECVRQDYPYTAG